MSEKSVLVQINEDLKSQATIKCERCSGMFIPQMIKRAFGKQLCVFCKPQEFLDWASRQPVSQLEGLPQAPEFKFSFPAPKKDQKIGRT